MDKHTYSERDYTYPNSPLYCQNKQYLKCEESDCNDEYRYKDVSKCMNCQIWRWRFVENNSLVVGDWFISAEEAENANLKDIEQTAKKLYQTTKICNAHSAMVYKFEHMKKKSKKHKAYKSVKHTLYDYVKPQRVVSHINKVTAQRSIQDVHQSSNCEKAKITTPDNASHNKKTVVTDSVEEMCSMCRSKECHNRKYGPYLYRLCLNIFDENANMGVKQEMESFTMMFGQRYHVLAEYESFQLNGMVELEYMDVKKRALPFCLKDGYFQKMKNDIQNNMI